VPFETLVSTIQVITKATLTVRSSYLDGGLVAWQRFNGLRAILSGPAGGVVGFSRTCYDEDNKTPCIGFDMGGKLLN
jgi:N-methylhydantoinase A/oxoprolinase/acetone carboxylase beta subunit